MRTTYVTTLHGVRIRVNKSAGWMVFRLSTGPTLLDSEYIYSITSFKQETLTGFSKRLDRMLRKLTDEQRLEILNFLKTYVNMHA